MKSSLCQLVGTYHLWHLLRLFIYGFRTFKTQSHLSGLFFILLFWLMAEINVKAGLLTKAACHTAVYSNKTLPQTKVFSVQGTFLIVSYIYIDCVCAALMSDGIYSIKLLWDNTFIEINLSKCISNTETIWEEKIIWIMQFLAFMCCLIFVPLKINHQTNFMNIC